MCKHWQVVEDENGQSFEYCRKARRQCSCSGVQRECLTRSYKKIVTALFLAYVFLFPSVEANAQPAIWQVIMAEAAGEGYKGMYAVACVIRNRGGDLHGFCGAKREDISLFCNRQGREVVREAQQIEHVVFERKGPDITKGATHFEAVEKYGVPYWIKDVQVTVKIGSHTFFKRRQDGRRSK